jgi:hypothetical protein
VSAAAQSVRLSSLNSVTVRLTVWKMPPLLRVMLMFYRSLHFYAGRQIFLFLPQKQVNL